MFRSTSIRIACSLVPIAAVMTGLALASPMGPVRRYLPDEIRSLANLKRVRIDVRPPQGALANSDLTIERFEEALTRHLDRVGIKIDDDPELPKLVLATVGVETEHHPEMLAWNLVIAVHQRVLLRRAGQELTVPTASMSQIMLVSRKESVKGIDPAVKKSINTLVEYVRQAELAQKSAQQQDSQTIPASP